MKRLATAALALTTPLLLAPESSNIPPIDRAAPTKIETATFAVG
jgi:hypothetical protein